MNQGITRAEDEQEEKDADEDEDEDEDQGRRRGRDEGQISPSSHRHSLFRSLHSSGVDPSHHPTGPCLDLGPN